MLVFLLLVLGSEDGHIPTFWLLLWGLLGSIGVYSGLVGSSFWGRGFYNAVGFEVCGDMQTVDLHALQVLRVRGG